MTVYAEGTSVSVDRSRIEVEGLLAKYGATQRVVSTDDIAGHVSIGFIVAGARYRIDIPMPKLASFEPGERKQRALHWEEKKPNERAAWLVKAHEQGCRERWRAVVLLVKAKLELVRLGVSTIEREFLADLVLPNGQTAHQALGDVIRRGLADGGLSKLLLSPPPAGP